jgi:hypothetical protein
MCIYCDLNKKDEDGEIARFAVDQMIRECEQIANYYKQIRKGNIKPHTEKMKIVVLCEKALVKRLVNDCL